MGQAGEEQEQNPVLTQFCSLIDEKDDFEILRARDIEDAVGKADVLAPVTIRGVEFRAILTIALRRSDFIYDPEAKIWVRYPISEEQVEVIEEHISPDNKRFLGPLDRQNWFEVWEYELSEGEIKRAVSEIDQVYGSMV